MQVTGTHHIALITRNLARLRDFYVDTLGLPVVGGFPGGTIIFIGVGGTAIELIEDTNRQSGPEQAGWAHLAWEVEDCDAVFAELSARGVPFHVEPKDAPAESPSVRIAFFRDPDGNVLELVQPLGDRYPEAVDWPVCVPGNHQPEHAPVLQHCCEGPADWLGRELNSMNEVHPYRDRIVQDPEIMVG